MSSRRGMPRRVSQLTKHSRLCWLSDSNMNLDGYALYDVDVFISPINTDIYILR